MTVNINQVIDWYQNRRGQLTYSMSGSRNGADGTADCSGALTQALYEAGASPYALLHSTDTLGHYLQENGFRCIGDKASDAKQRGDIILMSWGTSMQDSLDEGGHCGILSDADTFISVDYWTHGQSGSAVSSHPWLDYYQTIRRPSYLEIWRQNKK